MYLRFAELERARVRHEAPEQCHPALAGYRVVHDLVRLPAGVALPDEPVCPFVEILDGTGDIWLHVATCVSRPGSPVSGWVDWRTPQNPGRHVDRRGVPSSTATEAEIAKETKSVNHL